MPFDKYRIAHEIENCHGPGDDRPTAQQIIEEYHITNQWKDKVVIVTGCSSGMGIATAQAIKTTGAKVYATARNLEKGRAAMQDVLEPGRCELLELDLSSLESVRRFAVEFQSREAKLNILINNAGVGTVMDKERHETSDGFEVHFGVNHLSHFLLFQLLKPNLLAASTTAFRSRVVNVSSAAHRFTAVRLEDPNFELEGSYDPWLAYGSSKTANIWMTNHIERLYGKTSDSGRSIHGFAAHPGVSKTGFGGDATDWDTFLKSDPDLRNRLKSVEQAAATTVLAAVAPELEGKGGKYLADCHIPNVVRETDRQTRGGSDCMYWAYDEGGEKKLWELSNTLVKFNEA